MKIRYFFFLFSAFFFLSFSSLSQYVEFVGKVSKGTVTHGERFRVTYTINTRGEKFSSPSFQGLNILSGPNQSTSMRWINGKVSHSAEYNFVVSARKLGELVIEPASIIVQGKVIQSNEIKLTIKKGKVDLSQTPSESARKNAQKKIFASILTSKSKVYQGEPFLVKHRVYSRISISNVSQYNPNEESGLWTKEIEIPQVTLERTEIDGKDYVYLEMKKQVVIYQKSGKKALSPFKITCLAQNIDTRYGNSFFDRFFNQGVQEEYPLTSNQKKITVLPLPEKGKPKNFKGAVGKYTIRTSVVNTTVDVNDGITLKLEIKGEGNIELFEMPSIEKFADFEVFTPESKIQAKTESGTIKGKRTLEYLLIPKYSGKFSILPVEFSYFDPKQKKYVTKKTKPIGVTVTGVKKNVTIEGKNTSLQRESSVTRVKEDIRYLKKDISFVAPASSWYKSSLMFVLFGIPLVLFLISFGFRKYNDNLEANPIAFRIKKANAIAKKHLASANKVLKSDKKEGFYEEVITGVLKYLEYKLGIPVSDLSKENIASHLEKKGVGERLKQETLSVIERCEVARYASFSRESDPIKIFEVATNVVSELEKTITKK